MLSQNNLDDLNKLFCYRPVQSCYNLANYPIWYSFVPSNPTKPNLHPIQHGPVLSNPALSHQVLPVPSNLALSHPIQLCLIQSGHVPSNPVLFHPIRSCPFNPALSHPILPCPVKSNRRPGQFFHQKHCFILSHPVMFHFHSIRPCPNQPNPVSPNADLFQLIRWCPITIQPCPIRSGPVLIYPAMFHPIKPCPIQSDLVPSNLAMSHPLQPCPNQSIYVPTNQFMSQPSNHVPSNPALSILSNPTMSHTPCHVSSTSAYWIWSHIFKWIVQIRT